MSGHAMKGLLEWLVGYGMTVKPKGSIFQVSTGEMGIPSKESRSPIALHVRVVVLAACMNPRHHHS